MSITVCPQKNGNIVCSAIVGDYREHHNFIGYTAKEAVNIFAAAHGLNPADAYLEIRGKRLPIPKDESEEE